MAISTEQAIKLLTDEAERRGALPNDDDGLVRSIVTAHGLGFNAWFCVCCELADRNAQREGFKNQADRAASNPAFQEKAAAWRKTQRYAS